MSGSDRGGALNRTARARAPHASALAALLFALALLVPGWAGGQPRPDQRIGETVVERGSAHYRFERFVVASDDGSRRWRVTLGLPRGPAPAAGRPALYLLDGNAALMEFDEALLADLAAHAAPLLVFVGYDNALRIDTPARTRDYTPMAGSGEPGGAAGPGGGADAFLEAIERRIRPEVGRRAPVDPQRQAVWGHSLGGLFALHALYTRAGAFQAYAPASPSLWWRAGAMLGEPEQRFVAHNAGHPARVLLMQGSAERRPDGGGRDPRDARVRAQLERVSAVPADATRQLSQRLQQVPGLAVEYREFPGLGHGPMLRASLLYTLHALYGARDRSGEPPR